MSNSDLVLFYFFKKLKISENVLQKSLWQSFGNEKTEVAIFLLFPCCSSWCTPFFRSTHFSLRKTQNKMVCFEFFQKNENLWKCFAKISVTKFRKLKIWDGHILHFFMLFVVVYSLFRSMHLSWRKLRKKIACFDFFEKNWKKQKVQGETGVKNQKNVFFYCIHLQGMSELVVLDPQTFSIDPQKAV